MITLPVFHVAEIIFECQRFKKVFFLNHESRRVLVVISLAVQWELVLSSETWAYQWKHKLRNKWFNKRNQKHLPNKVYLPTFAILRMFVLSARSSDQQYYLNYNQWRPNGELLLSEQNGGQIYQVKYSKLCEFPCVWRRDTTVWFSVGIGALFQFYYVVLFFN